MPTKQEEFRLAESKLLDEIRELEEKNKNARQRLYKMRSENSELLAPLSVGQVLQHEGYPHKGKMVRVTGFIPAGHGFDHKTRKFSNWAATAVVLKKDETDSLFTVEIHGYVDPTKGDS